jgi:uncharacterized small protein (DUF1192 family)
MDMEDMPKPKAKMVIGEDLDSVSVAELEHRILLLEAEIFRVREEIAKKQAGKAAAASFFKI